MLTITNSVTGEVYDLPDDTPQGIKDSWLLLTSTIKTLEAAKDKLKPKVASMLDEKGQYDFGDYVFKQTFVQRMNYDKRMMRLMLDEDTVDLFLVPDKTAIDLWVKENLEQPNIAEAIASLRSSMVPQGEPYTTLRLERVK